VVAISDEPIDRLKSKMVKGEGATYWIGSDPENKTLASFVNEGSLGIPQFYLVDAAGTVVGMEVPSEKQLEKLLEAIFSLALDRSLHQKLERARLAYEWGSYAIAFQTADKLLTDKDQTVAADAKYLCEKVLKYAHYRRKILEAELKTAEPAQAYGNVLVMQHELAGVDPELKSWVDMERGRLAQTDEVKVKDERKAWGLFDKILRRELRGFASDYERGRVKVLYGELVEKHRRAAAAAFARKRLEKLAERR